MAKPTVIVEMELSGRGVGWTDVSADVIKAAGIRGGRGKHAQHPLARIADVGTLSFDLNNSAKNSQATRGYYSPTSVGGQSLLGTGVRLRLNTDIAALNPSGWYRADKVLLDGSGNVQTAYDISGNRRDLTQSNAALRPGWSGSVFVGSFAAPRAAFRFNNTASMALISSVVMSTFLGAGGQGTMVVVLKRNAAAVALDVICGLNTGANEACLFWNGGANFVAQDNDGINKTATATSAAGGTAGQILWWRKDSVNVQCAASNADDGGFVSTAAGTPLNIGNFGFRIGCDAGNPLWADIAEVILFSTPLLQADRRVVTAYLEDRYTTSITESSTVSSIKWSGFVSNAEPVPGIYADDPVVHVQCTDWMDHAQGFQLTGTAVQTSKTADQILTTLVAAMPIQPPGGTSFDVGPYTYAYGLDQYRQSSMTVVSELQKLMQSEWPSILYIGLSGALKYKKAPTGTTGVPGGANDFPGGFAKAFVATDLAEATFKYARASYISDLKGSMSPRTVDAANVVLFVLTTSQSIAHNGGTFKFQARYSDPTQRASRVGGITMVAPVAGTDYTANSAANASGTNLTANVVASVTFGSDSAEVTLTNNHATLDAFVGTGQTIAFQLRGIGIYTYQPIIIEKIAPTVTQLGQNIQQFDMSYQSDATKAALVVNGMSAYWALQNRADPIIKINASSKDATFLRDCLELDIASAISITEPVNAPSPLGVYVAAIDYEIDATGELFLTYTCIRPGSRTDQ